MLVITKTVTPDALQIKESHVERIGKIVATMEAVNHISMVIFAIKDFHWLIAHHHEDLINKSFKNYFNILYLM